MQQLKRTYRLRRFTSSQESDYIEALGIYVDSISLESRTNSNEITYWLDRSYREFGDEFVVCGFYLDRRVIGFAQFAFFRKARLLFFDYIALHEDYRCVGEYYQFGRMLQEWVDQAGFEFDYAVAEVSFESASDQPTRRSLRLARLFKQLGFGAAECAYRYPPLGENNPQSGMRAHLLIAGPARLERIKRETLSHILSTIYFQHYERWHMPFLQDRTEYRRVLTKLQKDAEKKLAGTAEVIINGLKMFCPPHRVQSKHKSRAASLPLAPIFVLFSFGVFCSGLLWVQASTKLDFKVTGVVFAGALVSLATAFALLRKDAREVLDLLLTALGRFFDKRK